MLTAQADGRLAAGRAVRAAFMATRLQGELAPDGALELSLWGAGALGTVRLAPFLGPCTYAPDLLTTAAGGLVAAARSRAALLVRGAELRGVSPARRPARWAEPGRGELTENGFVL
ncbi:hypothetical protein, partial [Phenylobacterium sp.]|uniref:hypothetical protein n=1 Tax=Phenylobacterium sp. TaxID=1871053 RepID=UPI002E320E5E